MPWGWGELTIDPDNPRSGPYHLVWPRDLYQVATALHAAGDTDCANDALDFAFDKQQLDDGSFPQNTQVDGRPKWTATQMDQVGLPIVLAHQLGRTGRSDWRHVRAAADYIVEHGPKTEQERWENQEGYSPATIAAQIAGLICAADIARRNGDSEARRRPTSARPTPGSATSSAGRRRPTARTRPSRTTCGSPRTAGRTRARPTRSATPARRRWTSARSSTSRFLELVRLGVKRPDDRGDRQHAAGRRREARDRARSGTASRFDGYGERRNGKPWRLFDDDTRRTLGRAWPIFAGERGEYELLAGRPAAAQLAAMASAANAGGMLPEQVWDGREPTG